MAAGLTDHVWTMEALLSFRVPPQHLWPSTILAPVIGTLPKIQVSAVSFLNRQILQHWAELLSILASSKRLSSVDNSSTNKEMKQ
jgi:hypothetical protein